MGIVSCLLFFPSLIHSFASSVSLLHVDDAALARSLQCRGSWSDLALVAGDLGGLSSPVAYGYEVSDLTHSYAPAVLDTAVPVNPMFHSLYIFCLCCTRSTVIGCVLTALCFWF